MTSPPAGATSAEAGRWVEARIGSSGFRTELTARAFHFVADEPVALGGTDAGPTPYEMLLGALAGCTAMTLRMYADRKRWPLETIHVALRSARSHAPDCESCETEKVGIGRIERKVELTGPLDDAQRRRLLEIADRCPVKQTLEHGIEVVDASG